MEKLHLRINHVLQFLDSYPEFIPDVYETLERFDPTSNYDINQDRDLLRHLFVGWFIEENTKRLKNNIDDDTCHSTN